MSLQVSYPWSYLDREVGGNCVHTQAKAKGWFWSPDRSQDNWEMAATTFQSWKRTPSSSGSLPLQVRKMRPQSGFLEVGQRDPGWADTKIPHSFYCTRWHLCISGQSGASLRECERSGVTKLSKHCIKNKSQLWKPLIQGWWELCQGRMRPLTPESTEQFKHDQKGNTQIVYVSWCSRHTGPPGKDSCQKKKKNQTWIWGPSSAYQVKGDTEECVFDPTAGTQRDRPSLGNSRSEVCTECMAQLIGDSNEIKHRDFVAWLKQTKITKT